jgi:hypothetical protein
LCVFNFGINPQKQLLACSSQVRQTFAQAFSVVAQCQLRQRPLR